MKHRNHRAVNQLHQCFIVKQNETRFPVPFPT